VSYAQGSCALFLELHILLFALYCSSFYIAKFIACIQSYLPDERARMESAGGHVIYDDVPHVHGILAMSRALGTPALFFRYFAETYIRNTHFSEHEELNTKYTSSLVCTGDRLLRPEVISKREITITQRSGADQCLILATDGMWDVINNETAYSVACQCLEDGDYYPPKDAHANAPGPVSPNSEHHCDVTTAVLAWLALCRGRPDDVSIVLVDLRNTAG
jgi:protein phosphatase 2C